MTDKEILTTIKVKVERLKSQLLRGACSSQIAMETSCKEEAYNEVLAMLDTLQEEQLTRSVTKTSDQEEPVSEELEEAAEKYAHEAYSHPVDRNIGKADFIVGANWQRKHLWKPADGDELPEIDREVIALVGLEGFFEIPPDEPVKLSYKVVFAHRPPEYWDGKNILTGEVTRHYTKRYDKGGWNIPNVKYWLDCSMPKVKEG